MNPDKKVKQVRYELTGHSLQSDGQTIIQLGADWAIEQDASGAGVFLRMTPAAPSPYVEQPLGNLVGLEKWVSLYRFSPFWMKPATGTSLDSLHPETLWLLAQTANHTYTMVVPLLSEDSRYSLRTRDGQLRVVAESGDPAVPCTSGVALFVTQGKHPYELAAAGAKAVQQFLKKGKLRKDKPLPDFVDQLGWCTWDAFYKEVTAAKVIDGLASFQRAGVSPKWMILDDGWQTWQPAPSGEDRLVSLKPNQHFDGDLSNLVQRAKSEFGIKRFLVWHALLGYWGGLGEKEFSEYDVRSVNRWFGPGILEQEPRWNVQPWGAQMGVPSIEKLEPFYKDWHAQLAQQGVDGVKVDAQALLESVSSGQGGRTKAASVARAALESSVNQHFEGRLINCMSCHSEGAYLSTHSTLMRSSDDFFPDRPDSHGLHLLVNAVVGIWFGEFMQPDWDMFHSAHPRGAFHAAARAISGGPIYVSDKVGMHDKDLLRQLVLSDGSVLRADFPGRLTRDCLFVDPIREAKLLKIFNLNRQAGVVGLFNVCENAQTIQGSVAAQDVEGLQPNRRYAAWSFKNDRLWTTESETPTSISLASGDWELVSFVPIEQGFAAFGLVDKLNGTGAILNREWQATVCRLMLRDGGQFMAWAEKAPSVVDCDGQSLAFTFDSPSGRLSFPVPIGGAREICLCW